MWPVCRLALALVAFLALTALGSAQQSQQVFSLPEGAYPHDVAPTPDGKVWYSAQRNGALGILDPSTGQSRQIKLGPKSAPHGVIQGPDGAAWLTDGGQNAIVRVDPETEKVTVWKLPDDTGYTNLNTAVFDKDGIHWFTGQNGFYGRLNPRSGDLKVWRAPRGRGPYGITVTPEGDVYYASLAGNHIARIDKANSWREWKLPGERPQAYAVYVDDNDIVWVSDWGADAILSFDPATEQFSSYPTSETDANVRQILGRSGEVWLPESGRDRLMVIRTARQLQ